MLESHFTVRTPYLLPLFLPHAFAIRIKCPIVVIVCVTFAVSNKAVVIVMPFTSPAGPGSLLVRKRRWGSIRLRYPDSVGRECNALFAGVATCVLGWLLVTQHIFPMLVVGYCARLHFHGPHLQVMQRRVYVRYLDFLPENLLVLPFFLGPHGHMPETAGCTRLIFNRLVPPCESQAFQFPFIGFPEPVDLLASYRIHPSNRLCHWT